MLQTVTQPFSMACLETRPHICSLLKASDSTGVIARLGRMGAMSWRAPLRASHFLAHDYSFMRPFQGDIPNLSSFPTPTGTTSHANAGWQWRRMMASCPGSCCQWMSPKCCRRRTRRVGVVVTTPSTTWAWSRKVSSTRADFFPPASLPSASPPF